MHGHCGKPDRTGTDRDRVCDLRPDHQEAVAGTGVLRAGARGKERKTVQVLQVPLDERQRRGTEKRADGAKRDGRAYV